MPKWLLPTLSEILALNDPTWSVEYVSAGDEADGNGLRRSASRAALQRVRAEREWTGAIAALSTMLHYAIATHVVEGLPSTCGLVLSGPLPVISHPNLVNKVSTWSLTTQSLHAAPWMPFKLLPSVDHQENGPENLTTSALPLLPDDPLAGEQFCLVLTPWFSLVMVLGETLMGEPAFMFSLMPNVVQQAWDAIRPRILLMNAHQVEQLDELMQKFPPIAPDYQTVMQFSRLMLKHLPDPLEDLRSDLNPDTRPEGVKEVVKQGDAVPLTCSLPDTPSPDVELLKALAHEIRTPLATIRTLTRSLLKRPDLSPDVIKRLNSIDRECSEQIDRFGLIFKAVELETSSVRNTAMSLTRTSLAQVFQTSIPRWQKQASQRQMTLDVSLPQKMPTVVSDPTMLDQALTSLIERFTRNLPAGSHIKVEVTPAGSQLKLQLESNPQEATEAANSLFGSQGVHQPLLKAIGQLLMFQPETGSLSLNLAVTKNLFQALGGKLIVKQRPQQGEVMTVFLPLEVGGSNVVDV